MQTSQILTLGVHAHTGCFHISYGVPLVRSEWENFTMFPFSAVRLVFTHFRSTRRTTEYHVSMTSVCIRKRGAACFHDSLVPAGIVSHELSLKLVIAFYIDAYITFSKWLCHKGMQGGGWKILCWCPWDGKCTYCDDSGPPHQTQTQMNNRVSYVCGLKEEQS